MAKYLIVANYTAEGAKGLLSKGATARVNAVRSSIEAAGGKLESFYYAFGDDDAFVVVDLPDNVSAAAVALTVAASGMVAIKTTVLLTPSEIDEAAKKSVAYTPPGG